MQLRNKPLQQFNMPWMSGQYYGSTSLYSNTLSATGVPSNLLHATPFMFPSGGPSRGINSIGLNVTIAGAAGTKMFLGIARMGNDGLPGALFASSVELPTDVVNPVEDQTFVYNLPTDTVLFLLSIFSGTPTVASFSFQSNPWGETSIADTGFRTGRRTPMTYGPLPQSLSGLTWVGAVQPNVLVRAQ